VGLVFGKSSRIGETSVEMMMSVDHLISELESNQEKEAGGGTHLAT
jgi:hypothetical protein